MRGQKDSVRIEARTFDKAAFSKERYRPGVIAPPRMLWGSAGAGFSLLVVALLSQAAGIELFLPPLAASCFIGGACVYLRVARPKPVIVGHFVASLAGLFALWAGRFFPFDGAWTLCLQMALALFAASVLMQAFDADHPPAAATAVIPVIMPLAAPWHLFPLHMAWGAAVTVLVGMAWNRVWFEFPARDSEHDARCAGLFLPGPQVAGLAACAVGAVLMPCKSAYAAAYALGLACTALGVFLLGTHHYWRFFSFFRAAR